MKIKSPTVFYKESPQPLQRVPTPKIGTMERSKSKDKDELNNFLLHQKPSEDSGIAVFKPIAKNKEKKGEQLEE